MKHCFFVGHRDCSENIYPRLYEAIKRHVEECGVGEFIVGRYGSFDHMAARTVIQMKAVCPDVRLVLLCPYRPADGFQIPNGFDELYYPFETSVPYRYAIVRANKKAISMCDCLIACVYRISKSRDFLDYAEKRRDKGLIMIENLSK